MQVALISLADIHAKPGPSSDTFTFNKKDVQGIKDQVAKNPFIELTGNANNSRVSTT